MATIVSYTARPRRLTQALLLASAVVIGVGAYALVGLGRYDELPANLMQYGIGAAVLALEQAAPGTAVAEAPVLTHVEPVAAHRDHYRERLERFEALADLA